MLNDWFGVAGCVIGGLPVAALILSYASSGARNSLMARWTLIRAKDGKNCRLYAASDVSAAITCGTQGPQRPENVL